eukprot:CAMPEP_0185030954 /NCGR_PEP_ID=MMETSP1103-20130426/18119_1 /TAXON_ID=36769 /ORGANISM="Paraphysomonas bandaiensis, Strain Caron Lab Isolate" /LENGTH=473 /DNA_ID=CAMNT_0027566271 /DNA_START=719 /DNA_END=2140 /DNA_ORIENTATION=+
MIPAYIARKEKSTAENLFSIKKRFVKYVSREVRMTLDTVYIGLDLAIDMSRRLANAEELERLVSDIKVSCGLVDRVLDDIFIVDDMEDNKLFLYRRIVRAVDVICNAMKPMEFMARRADITLAYRGAEYIHDNALNAMIDVDENKITQVIRNLVSNALKYTPSGGQVSVFCFIKRDTTAEEVGDEENGLRSKDDILRIEIHDTGPGIPEEKQAEIFRRTMQDNAASAAAEGSGVGVWISNTLVKLHNGNLGVVSECGKGCMFFIELQTVDPTISLINTVDDLTTGSERKHPTLMTSDDDAGDVEMGYNVEEKVITIVDVELKRVLIASTCRETRELVRAALGNCGHIEETVETCNGNETISAADMSVSLADPIDVIFIHCDLPGRNPLAVISNIRKVGFTGKTVLLSNENMPDTNERFVRCGGDVVLKRPFVVSEIEHVLLDVYTSIHKMKPSPLLEATDSTNRMRQSAILGL